MDRSATVLITAYMYIALFFRVDKEVAVASPY
jgi:hypothetical protein